MTKLLDDEDGNYLDLGPVPVDADVVGEMRSLNARHGAGSARLWQLVVEFDEDDGWGGGPSMWLTAGLAGPRGALIWVEPGRTFIPAGGLRRLRDQHDWLSYLDWSGTPCSVRGAASVPIEQVFAVVKEVVATRRRPELVAMTEIDCHRFRIVGPRIEHPSHSAFHRSA